MLKSTVRIQVFYGRSNGALRPFVLFNVARAKTFRAINNDANPVKFPASAPPWVGARI